DQHAWYTHDAPAITGTRRSNPSATDTTASGTSTGLPLALSCRFPSTDLPSGENRIPLKAVPVSTRGLRVSRGTTYDRVAGGSNGSCTTDSSAFPSGETSIIPCPVGRASGV